MRVKVYRISANAFAAYCLLFSYVIAKKNIYVFLSLQHHTKIEIKVLSHQKPVIMFNIFIFGVNHWGMKNNPNFGQTIGVVSGRRGSYLLRNVTNSREKNIKRCKKI
jgi:hypothetical protein